MKMLLFLAAAFLAFLTPFQAAIPNKIPGEQNSFYVWPSVDDSTILSGRDNYGANNRFPASWREMRCILSDNGIDFNLIFAGDAFHMVSGGNEIKSDLLYRADLKVVFDFEKLMGWKGAGFYLNFMGTEGGKPSQASGTGQGISNIEAPDTWKLYEFYITQSILDDKLSLLFGTFDLNSEFDTKLSSALFLNPSHGIGPDYSQSGVNGPSIFPTTSLAFRARYNLDDFSFLAAVFDGIPGNQENPAGTHIILHKDDGLLLAGEADYIPNGDEFAVGYQKFSIGGWYYTSRSEDLSEVGLQPGPVLKNNFGIYLQGEKFLFSENHDPAQGLAAFIRYGFAHKDVNKYSDYLGFGATYTGLLPERDSDILGLGIAAVRNSLKFKRSLALQDIKIKSYEVNIELTYQMKILEILMLQPDIQYVIYPVFAPEKDYSLSAGVRAQLTL